MKTSSLSRGSRSFSSEGNANTNVNESQTQMGPLPHDQKEGDAMVARYSWYYEEKETSRFEDRGTIEDHSIERHSSTSLVFRLNLVKDSLLYRESNA
jgi:hypothetical protein